ncbi:MAG: hypothetical protein AAF713_22245 [Pseudomonadota bacterium]
MLVHLGYQKAASTFLQKSVFSNHDVFELPWGNPADEAIEHLVLSHYERLDFKHLRASTIGVKNRLPVISHEDLLAHPTEGRYYAETTLHRLKSLFPNARLLICIREQREMFFSLYFQYIRQGGTESLKMLLSRHDHQAGFRPMFRRDHFEYDLMLDLVLRFFPAEQVLMQPHEFLRTDPKRYFSQLSGLCEMPISAASPDRVVNMRIAGPALPIQRMLNRLITQRPHPGIEYDQSPLSMRIKNRAVRVADRLLGSSSRLSQRFDQRIRNTIEEMLGSYFAQSNSRLAKMLDIDLKSLGYRTMD